jgi:hypothetical protein
MKNKEKVLGVEKMCKNKVRISKRCEIAEEFSLFSHGHHSPKKKVIGTHFTPQS